MKIFMTFRDFSCTILNQISDVQYTSLKYDYKPHRIDYEKQGILGIGCTHNCSESMVPLGDIVPFKIPLVF